MSVKSKQLLQELCVFGFIRTHCIGFTIPYDLQQICFKMYMILVDEWDINKANKQILVNKSTKKVIINNNTEGTWYNAFGATTIKKGEIYTWRFIIKHNNINDNGVAIFIGVIETYKISSEMRSFFANSKNSGYAFYTWHGSKYSPREYSVEYGPKAISNDTITMTLDMTQDKNTNALLSFEVNNKEYGIAFKDMDIDQQYSMAVSLYDIEDDIQLIE
eukprot:2491_1